jgi:CRISPR-associated protein Csx14
MTNQDPTIRIDVDVTNPGQFFACCGLLELADRLWPGAQGWFGNSDFNLRTNGTLREILFRLTRNAPRQLEKVCGDIPVKPIIAPLEFELDDGGPRALVIDFWMRVDLVKGKVQAVSNPPWNFWSGQQTPIRIWLPLRNALQGIIAKHSDEQMVRLFTLRSPLKGRFGFDSLAAWNALDLGFSPNDQDMAVSSSPASELLSAIGLQRFRPLVSPDRSIISYATWSVPASVLVAPTMACLAVFGRGTRYELPVISRGQYAALGHAEPKQGVSHE